jgi:hypothetical protein
MKYQVVISGDEIFFENYNGDEPVIGFIACRQVAANSEDLAIAIAKRDLLVLWNQSFNADRKLGMPRLEIEHVRPIKGWFTRKIPHDFYWFTSELHKQEQLRQFIQSAPAWQFWRR